MTKITDINIKDCLTVNELMQLKQCSNGAVYKAIKEGRLDFVQIGKVKLIVKNNKLNDFKN